MFFVRMAVPDPVRPEGATMSVATLSDTLPGVPVGQPKTRWFKAPDSEDDPANPGDFDNWPRAARRLWKILLRQARKLGTKVIVLPVWKLAEVCGRGQRWVWKAFRQLLALGVIRRFWCDGRREVENRKGHHGDVGRGTEIVIDLAGPEPKAKPAPKPKAKATGKPATLEQQAAADRAHAETAAINAQGGDPLPPGWHWQQFLPPAAAVAPPAPKPPVEPPTSAPRRPRLAIPVAIHQELQARQQARLAKLEAIPPEQRSEDQQQEWATLSRLLGEPAGPEVPAPGSGS
jgi:hypothetical protein